MMDLIREEHFDLKTLQDMTIKDFVTFYNIHAERIERINKMIEAQNKM